MKVLLAVVGGTFVIAVLVLRSMNFRVDTYLEMIVAASLVFVFVLAALAFVVWKLIGRQD